MRMSLNRGGGASLLWSLDVKNPLEGGLEGLANKKLDDALLSQVSTHYHRRKGVSLSCSGWEGVGPPCYGRQA